MATITANDRPRYDGWGPDNPWSCAEWIAWHRALSAAYGAELADEVWASAWLDGLSRAGGGRGLAAGSGLVFDAVPVSCRTVDGEFANYVAQRPKLQAAVFTGIGGTIAAPVAGAAGLLRKGGEILDVGSRVPTGIWILGGLTIAVLILRR